MAKYRVAVILRGLLVEGQDWIETEEFEVVGSRVPVCVAGQTVFLTKEGYQDTTDGRREVFPSLLPEVKLQPASGVLIKKRGDIWVGIHREK